MREALREQARTWKVAVSPKQLPKKQSISLKRLAVLAQTHMSELMPEESAEVTLSSGDLQRVAKQALEIVQARQKRKRMAKESLMEEAMRVAVQELEQMEQEPDEEDGDDEFSRPSGQGQYRSHTGKTGHTPERKRQKNERQPKRGKGKGKGNGPSAVTDFGTGAGNDVADLGLDGMSINVDLIGDDDDTAVVANLQANAANDAEEDEGVCQYIVSQWTSTQKSDIVQMIYRQHNRMSLLQGWITNMNPITYALVFQSFNTHGIAMNRKEVAGKTRALAIAKVHTADAVNDVLRDITHQSEVRRIYKRLLSAYLAAHYMKHTYKQGVPPRLLALLNSPITTQENVE